MGGTFAIEIADMRNARQVLYGVDPVPTPNASDLRYHAEHEIRQTMRHVRLRLLLAAKEPREIGHLLVPIRGSRAAQVRPRNEGALAAGAVPPKPKGPEHQRTIWAYHRRSHCG